LTKEFEDLRHVVAEQIGHIQKAEAGRRSGEFGQAGVCGGLPVGAGGVREAKYGSHAAYYRRWSGGHASLVYRDIRAM
jgi:hypothetical protein